MNRIFFALTRARRLPGRFARSAVIWIWGVTVLRLANFIVVLPIALRALPSETLGLWYLMLNVVGLVTLLEFGLSAAVSRHATFFWAGTGKTGDGESREPNWNGLGGLVELAKKIYGWLGWAALVGALSGGAWLAYTHPDAMLRPSSLIAYGLLTIATFLRMRGLFWNPLLFGVERVRQSQQIQFTGILLSYAVSLGGLLAGGKLIALAAGQVVLLVYPLYRSQWVVRSQLAAAFRVPSMVVPWQPIWSATWRAGAVLLGSWLGTYGLVFACGQTAGLVTSASFALSNLVAFTIHFSAQSWMMARYPTISALWAKNERAAISHLVSRRIALSMATFLGASALAWVILPRLLILVGSKTPALPGAALAVLFAIAALDLFVALHSSVLASCNLFPQMRAILAAGTLTIALAFILGSKFGLWGILLAPIVCQGVSTVWIVPIQCWRILRSPDNRSTGAAM